MLGLGASLNGSLIKEGDDVYFECRVRYQHLPPVFLSAGKSSCSKINLFINQGKPEGIQDLLEMQCESSFGTFIQNISFPGSVLSVFQKLMLSTGENAPKQLWGWSFIAFICCKCFKTVRMLLQMQKCARSDHFSAICHKKGWMHLCLPFSFTTPLPNVSFKLQLMQPSFGNCDLQSKLDFPRPRTLEMSEHLGPIQTISFPLQRKPFDQVQLHQLSFKGIIRGWKLIALFSMQALLWLQL